MISKEDILDLSRSGLLRQIAEHKAKEKKASGNLRAGNAGVVAMNQGKLKVFGGCHRLALLRMLGINLEAEEHVHRIFEEGRIDEERVYERWSRSPKLKQAGISIKREEEIPVTITINETGKLVTGRPDLVLMDDALDKPVLIAELKKKLTPNGFQNVVDKCKPDNAHLAQAALYSYGLGECYNDGKSVDAIILYSWPILSDSYSRYQYYTSKLAHSYLSPPKFKSKDPSKAKLGIMPGEKIFFLDWDEDGYLTYITEGLTSPVKTVITKSAIYNFYLMVSRMNEEKALYGRPTSASVGAGVEGGWSPCGFCVLNQICKDYEHDYNLWLDMVRAKATELELWTIEQ